MISQIAAGVFDEFPPGFYFVVSVTGIILVLAANTAFNGFPVLGSILAQDGLLPRALGSRGDRLAYSNGIVFLAMMAILLIWAFDAETTKLIQLYIVGVFVSFNLSQLGMIRHWTRHLKTEQRPGRAPPDAALARDQHLRPRHSPPWCWSSCWSPSSSPAPGSRSSRWASSSRSCRRSTGTTATSRSSWPPTRRTRCCPTRVHAIVLVGKLHKPTLRALAFAKASRPNVLEGVYVSTDAAADQPDARPSGTSATSAYRSRCCTRPTARSCARSSSTPRRSGAANPRGVVAVYIPEYVVGRWWEQLLHNQTALRLKGRLLFTPGVMVISVPYQLRSSDRRAGAGQPRGRPDPLGRPAARQRGRAHPLGPPGPAVTRRPRQRRPRRSLAGRGAVHRRGRPGRARRSLRGPDLRRDAGDGGRVVFVRHALPGETVDIEVTEGTEGDRFWRADAVAVRRRLARPGAGRPARTPDPTPAAAATSSTSRCPRSAPSRRPWSASS